MGDKPIPFHVFIAHERARLDQFEAMWRMNMAKNPQQFPAKLLAGDWDEQLMMFDPEDCPND